MARPDGLVGVEELPDLVDDELRRARGHDDEVAEEQVPAHRSQPALGDALLHVLIEAAAGELAEPVGPQPLLAAAPQRDHVRLAEALAGVVVERAGHLASHGGRHLAIRVEVPGEDGSGVPVEERVVDVEDGSGALEGLHHPSPVS